MKTVNLGMITLLFLGLGSSAFASGFKCESVHSRQAYTVRLYNHVSPTTGTRVPAVLVISEEEQGTLLVRKNGEISKHVRANSVQYVVNGNERLGVERAILQIAFREGREVLAAGESVDGQLILVREDGGRSVTDLTCSRYLKGE
jgi:hypothetical protein